MLLCSLHAVRVAPEKLFSFFLKRSCRISSISRYATLFTLLLLLCFAHGVCNKAAGVPLNEYSVPKEKVANIQSQLERLMEKNYYLYQSARDAYRGYVLSYQSHKLKECYDVFKLDLQRVSKSFGFSGLFIHLMAASLFF